MSQIGFKSLIVRALPGTISDLVKKSGCAESTIRRWLNRMRADGECHIARWRRTGGSLTPFYVAGRGVDAVCNLKARTNAQYCRRSRAKMQGTEHGDVQHARELARKVADRSAAKQQTWAAALFVDARARGARHA